MISNLNAGDRAALITTDISGKEALRLKSEKAVLLRELEQTELADGSANFSAALTKAYELLNIPAGQKEIRLITDLGLTGWDQFSTSSLKQYDPSIPFKTIRIDNKQKPLNGTVKAVRLARQGVGVNLPIDLEATIANFGDREIKDLLVQLSIDGQNKEQKLATIPAKGETTVGFQTRLGGDGGHFGQVALKKEGMAGNPSSNFALDAQAKIKILVVDGDPQTSLVQSETFFLSRALNPAGDKDSSMFLPTVIIQDGLNTAALESYQVVMLCNVATLSDGVLTKLQDFVRQGGGLLIFSGDKLPAEYYNQRLASYLPAQLHDKKVGPEPSGEKIDKVDVTHPALQGFPTLAFGSAQVGSGLGLHPRCAGGKVRADCSRQRRSPHVGTKAGNGRVILITTSADRDWSDLPLKTAYLPLLQSTATSISRRQARRLDGGIAVGTAKEIALPANTVGKALRITKPNKLCAEVSVSADKDRALAKFEDNDRAGIYRVGLPLGVDKDSGAPQLYAVNPPFLESRLEEISERELQEKLRPIRTEVLPVEALKQGGQRTDMALPLLGLLIVTLLLEGWLAQRF